MAEATKAAPSTSSGQAKTKKTAPKAATKPSKAPSGVFAVIATGGKQYKVSEGTVLKIEKMKGEYKVGDKLTFNEVLLMGTTVGTPTVLNASVTGELVAIGRAPKVIVIKYKQKSRYFKKNGHRQPYFQVKITSIK